MHCNPDLVRRELAELLALGAVRRAQPEEVLFYQRIFLVSKKGDSGLRPVIDCRALNQHIQPTPFRCEGFDEIVLALSRNAWMCRLDLTKAYLHVPMAPEVVPFLGFSWEGATYLCIALPFGLRTSPFIFTKLMRVLVKTLRRQGVVMVIYMDDLLVVGRSREGCVAHLSAVIHLLEDTGFTINYTKSVVTPSQQMDFLGNHFDTVSMKITLTPKRLQDILGVARSLSQQRVTTLRRLAAFLGLLTAARPACEEIFLHTVHLNRCKTAATRAQPTWTTSMTRSPTVSRPRRGRHCETV